MKGRKKIFTLILQKKGRQKGRKDIHLPSLHKRKKQVSRPTLLHLLISFSFFISLFVLSLNET